MSALSLLRDPDWRRLGTSAASLVVGRVVSASCGLLQVPVVLASLGADRFGLWIALTALLWTLSSFDGGLGFALQGRIGQMLATEKKREAASLVRFGGRALSCFALGLLLLGAPFVIWGRWNLWLGVGSAVPMREMMPAVALVLIGAALNLPLSLATRIAGAGQQMGLTGFWTAVSSVLGLGVAVLAAWLELPLVCFVLAALLPLLGPPIGTWWQLFRQHDWLRQGVTRAPSPPGVWRESVLFFLPQLGAVFFGAFVPALVAFFCDSAAAGTFGVLQRLFGLALQVHGMLLMPTWPAYTQAAARGDAVFVGRTYRLSWIVTALVFVGPTLALTPTVPFVLQWWLGGRAPEVSAVLLWSVAGWHILQYCGQPVAMALNGLGRPGSMATTGWIGIVATILLCPSLAGSWGLVGVIGSLVLPYLMVNLPVTWWHARRAIAQVGAQTTVAV